MTSWKIEFGDSFYAVIEFDKNLKLIKQSAQDEADNLAAKPNQEWSVFDPHRTRIKDVQNPKDVYDADLLISQIFYEERYTIEVTGLDWSKVLEKAQPGRKY